MKYLIDIASRYKIEISLVLFTIFSSLVLLANVGAFSHDELQKRDYITEHGLVSYIRDFVIFIPDGNFIGFPFRPIGFAFQGFSSYFMDTIPFISHLLDVFLHALVGILLFHVVLLIWKREKVAYISSILFLISPLTTFSVGWVAASMDRLYVLFLMAIILLCVRKIRNDAFINDKYFAGLIFILTFLGLLSKETMVIAPLTLAMLWFVDYGPEVTERRKTIILAVTVSIAGLFAYCLLRLHAIIGTLTNPLGSGGYSISAVNIYNNVIAYFAYPFLLTLNEVANISFIKHSYIFFAVTVHFVFIYIIMLRFGYKKAMIYILCYFVSLTPVLLIKNMGGQYLYAAAIPMSIILSILMQDQYLHKVAKLFLVAIIFTLTFHAIVNQFYIYNIGSCMNKASITLQSHIDRSSKKNIAIFDDNGASDYIIKRITTGREAAITGQNDGRIVYTNSDMPNIGNENFINLHFNSKCMIYEK